MMQSFSTKVRAALKVGLVPQPDALTCQSACVGMAIGDRDVNKIRRELTKIGSAGDPSVMGQYLRSEVGSRYLFDIDASLVEAREYLKQGCFLITHGWFTNSGHVIAIDGFEMNPSTLGYKLKVLDPWSQFNFRDWAYNLGDTGYDGYYSSHGIYAACVAGQSVSHAQSIYRRGELDSARKGMWLHIVKPET